MVVAAAPVLSLRLQSNTSTFDRGDSIMLSFMIRSLHVAAHNVETTIDMPCDCGDMLLSTLSCTHPPNITTLTSMDMIVSFSVTHVGETVTCSFVFDATLDIKLGQTVVFSAVLDYKSLSPAAEISENFLGRLSSISKDVELLVVSPPPVGNIHIPNVHQSPGGDYYVSSGTEVTVNLTLFLPEVTTDLQLILALMNASTIPLANSFNFTTGRDIVLQERNLSSLSSGAVTCTQPSWACIVDIGLMENQGREDGQGFLSLSFPLQLFRLEEGTAIDITAVANYTNITGQERAFLDTATLLVRRPTLEIARFTHNLSLAADAGDTVELQSTIVHSAGSVVPAVRPTLLVKHIHMSLSLTGNASAVLSGVTQSFPVSGLVRNGINVSDIQSSQELVISFLVHLLDSVRPQSQMTLNLTVQYGEEGITRLYSVKC